MPTFYAHIVKRNPANSSTNTITFEVEGTSEKAEKYGPKNHYKDVQMIGRHYLVM